MARDFASRQIAPIAREIDRDAKFPEDIVKAMAPLGLLGASIPPEYGGQGIDHIGCAIIAEEIARHCSSIAISIIGAHAVVGEIINKWGTEAQKKAHLPGMCKGDVFSCCALDEPNIGSNTAGITNLAIFDGDQWVFKGTNKAVINGGVSSLALVFAETDTGDIGAFLVERNSSGLLSKDIPYKVGLRPCNIAELTLDNCRVSQDNVLGRIGEGSMIAETALDNVHFGLGAACIGILQACLDAAVTYARERQAFGNFIGSYHMVQELIADIAVGLQAGRWLVYHVGDLKNKKQPFTKEAATAKHFTSETTTQAAINAMQVHGASGYTSEYPMERYLRDANTIALLGGTSLRHKLMIAGPMIGFDPFQGIPA